MIHSNSISDFFNIGSAGLANRRDRVDIRNFQGQKRIRAMLDELGAVDIGDENRRHKRLVNFLHEVDRMFALGSYHDAVGMH